MHTRRLEREKKSSVRPFNEKNNNQQNYYDLYYIFFHPPYFSTVRTAGNLAERAWLSAPTERELG